MGAGACTGLGRGVVYSMPIYGKCVFQEQGLTMLFWSSNLKICLHSTSPTMVPVSVCNLRKIRIYSLRERQCARRGAAFWATCDSYPCFWGGFYP